MRRNRRKGIHFDGGILLDELEHLTGGASRSKARMINGLSASE